MRVAEGEVHLAGRREEEAEHRLAEAVALGVAEALHDREALAVDPVGDEHAPGGELGVDSRDEDVRVIAPVARDAPAVLCLELVVELLRDALSQLVDERPAVQAGAEALDERDERAGGA